MSGVVIQPSPAAETRWRSLLRWFVPVALTWLGVRLWMPPYEPSVSDWVLRVVYVAVVPLAWKNALRRPAPPSPATHDSD